ncbi:MAG: methyltransferase domain-containing protein [Spirochaeta sp.]|nr:methyltransferase domain-containing protein [Spirochaeta sp.]
MLVKKTTTPQVLLNNIGTLPELLSNIAANMLLEFEIGCGNGHFLHRYAEEKKLSYLIGVEVKKKRCLKALKKIQTYELTNAAIIQGKAEELIEQLPANSVDKFHIYFPDPWPKTKHRRRRFLRMTNLENLCRSLKPGGEILFCSDIYDYYLQAKLLFLISGELKLRETPPPPQVLKSIFGRKFSSVGKKIFFISSRKLTD